MTILEEKYVEGRTERDMEIATQLFASQRDIAETIQFLRELKISDDVIEAARKQRPNLRHEK